MDLTKKFPKISFPGSGGLKVSILFASGNSLLLLLLGFYELDPPGVPLRSLLEGIPFYLLSFLTFTVFSGSCFLFQKRQTDRLRKELAGQKETLEKTVTLLEEVTGFYQSSSLISARKDESLLLDLIARESLKCLRAHRAILFLQGEGSPQPKVGSVFASEAAHESANLEVEKECARRTLSQRRALLFRESRDLADLFPKGGKTRSVCSLLSVPLIWLGKPFGALNVSLMSGDRKFNEKDLECLSLFSHHAAAAIQNTGEGGKVNLHRDFDRELEGIADSLRRLSRDEQREILGQVQELLAKRGAETIGGSPNKPSGLSGTSVSSGGFQSGPTQRTEKGGRKKSCMSRPATRPLSFPKNLEMAVCLSARPIPLNWGSGSSFVCTTETGMSPLK